MVCASFAVIVVVYIHYPAVYAWSPLQAIGSRAMYAWLDQEYEQANHATYAYSIIHTRKIGQMIEMYFHWLHNSH